MRDAPIARMAATNLAAGGVEVFFGEKVVEVLGDGRVTGVRTDKRTIEAELAIMVVGMRPEVTPEPMRADPGLLPRNRSAGGRGEPVTRVGEAASKG
ncbi:MAG: hypothetical protein HY900_00210 [Deltaproteobacteria bacterium]|nr:hypothetical protein [Deltaproteobacteria bacterium]